MNVGPYRMAIAVVVFAMQLLGAVAAHSHGRVPAEAPACNMACCAQGDCECSAAPVDSPSQPAPAVPGPFEAPLKFFPVVLATVPAPVYRGTAMATPKIGDFPSAWEEHGAELFLLDCSLLM